jgi:O-antigen/teichoic acid export membrane protein
MREIKKSFGDFITLSGATVLSIPLMMFSESIQGRFLGPERYGKVALILSIIQFSLMFGLNWLFPTISRFGKKEFHESSHIRKTFTAFLLNSIIALVIIFLILIILAPFFQSLLDVKHPWHLLIIPLGVIVSFFKTFVFEVLKTIRLLKIYSILQKLGLKIFVLSGVSLFAFNVINVTVENMVVIYIISDILVIFFSFHFIKISYLFPLKLDKSLQKEMIIWGYTLIFGSISGYIANYVDMYVIKYYLNMVDVGYYQAAYKMYMTLAAFISIIGTITVPIILILRANKSNKIKDIYFLRITPQIAFAGFVFVSFVLMSSDYIYLIIYGNKYNASILPFQFLAIGVAFQFITITLGGLFGAYDIIKYSVAVNVVFGVLNIVGDLILIPIMGINGGAVTTMLLKIFSAISYLVIINRLFNTKRYFALLFPFAVMLFSISVLLYTKIVQIGVFIAILIILINISKKHNLFNENDAEWLANVKMPKRVRNILMKLLIGLSSDNEHNEI